MPKKFEMAAPGRAYISSSHIWDNKENEKKFFKSQLYIMSEFCHKSVFNLKGYSDGEILQDKWYEAGPIYSYESLEMLIGMTESYCDLPLVMQIWLGETQGKTSVLLHTTLLLGKNDKGDFMVWEKSGISMPFQVIELEKVYKAYERFTGWRIRPLSV